MSQSRSHPLTIQELETLNTIAEAGEGRFFGGRTYQGYLHQTIEREITRRGLLFKKHVIQHEGSVVYEIWRKQ